jgi:cysteine desulfurase
MKVYLDNAATTKTDERVVDAMLPYFTEKYGNASSLHSAGDDANRAMQNARATIAKRINALPEEIIFTSGGTESDNLAIKGYAYANKERGNHIITSKIEHPAVLNSCRQLELEGFKVTYLDVDKDGLLDPKDVEKNINPKTLLATIMHANNEIGTIEPIEEIGKICRKHNVAFHTDAVQSFCKTPIDVNKLNIDMLSASGHKIHGPKGVGMLYVRKGTKIQRLADGGAHEFKLRAGTENVAGIVGFAKAVELSNENECVRIQELREILQEGLLRIPDTKQNGRPDKGLCNNLNISFKYVEGEGLLFMLNDMGIEVSTGSACSSKSLSPSHVLIAIGLPHEVAHGSIRFSLSRYNTEEEIMYTIEKVKEAVIKLRSISPLQVK